VILVGLALFLFVLVSQVIRDGGAAVSWYRRTYDSRSVEYARLAQLHSDLKLAAFDEQLGPPLYQSHSSDHHWTQYLFQRRNYWVQALTENGGDTVRAFAVTTCDQSFTPSFYEFGRKIVLNRSHVADLHSGLPLVSFHWTVPADQPPWFYTMVGGSHVDNFQSFALGEDAACGVNAARIRWKPPRGKNYFQGTVALGRISKPFAQSLVTNTFAEWGPSQAYWPSKSFPIGVDEVRVVALSNSSPPSR
jgi:hypothetical protein